MQTDIHVSVAYAELMIADGKIVKITPVKGNSVSVTVSDIGDTDIEDVSIEAIRHGAHTIRQVTSNRSINIVSTFYK